MDGKTVCRKVRGRGLSAAGCVVYLAVVFPALWSPASAEPPGMRTQAGPPQTQTTPSAGAELAHTGFSCRDCHLGARGPANTAGAPARPCQDCHSSSGGASQRGTAPSVELLHRQAPGSPECVVCHGHHDILRVDSPSAAVYWRNVPRLCGSCHMDARLRSAVPQVPEYAASRHGQLALGAVTEQRPAVCTDCHGIHPQALGHPNRLLPQRQTIAATCGQCHQREYAEYSSSAHGRAMLRGDRDAAVCTDCHTEHSIVSPASKDSPVYAANVVATCSKCHGNANLVRLHGLPTARLSSYQSTYHGVANRYGDLRVANCVSCHGAHGILPASDPASTVNARNVSTTCASCHSGAQSWVAVGQAHVATSGPQARGLFYVGLIYRFFVFVTLAAFLGYILLELAAYARERHRERREGHAKILPLLPEQQEEWLLRLTWIERVQHYVLLVTFVLLAASGVVLLIPDSDVARVIVALSGGMSGRALVHRVAAGGLLGLGLFHVGWVATTRRGREVVWYMLPRWGDVVHAFQTAFFILGWSSVTARFGRFTFIEKFEYWAVSWGLFSMGVTGAVMTFTDWSLRHLPRWVWEACQIVHRWEALLAILTIAIWHLYHALWRPGGPNWSWVTGYLTSEQLAHEHPAEFQRALTKAEAATAPQLDPNGEAQN